MRKIIGIGGALLLSGTLFGAVYEAEDFVVNKASAAVIVQKDASGGKCVRMLGNGNKDPKANPVGVRWKFKVAKTGKYDLTLRGWMRDGGSDSAWLVLDGGTPEYTGFGKYKVWSDLTKNSVILTAGEHTLELIPREPGFVVDLLNVAPAGRYAKRDLERFAAPPVYPVKGQHPRVLLRPQDIPVIRARLTHPENAASWTVVQKLAARPLVEKLDPKKHTNACGLYSAEVQSEIVARAFVYLMNGDEKLGREAVKSVLGVLETTAFKKGFQDVTRQIGSLVFTAGIVYDWCYKLMTPEQREYVIDRAETFCAQMEVGFPPVRQGNVTGHGSEAQIFRDLFCYGIAVYDESPEMYRITAGRVFGELAEARRFFHKSGRYHQGSAYGQYRFAWELYGALAARRLCGIEIYDHNAAERVFDWAYNRLPDGSFFPEGDNYYRERLFTRAVETPFNLFALTGDPLAKAEFLLQGADGVCRGNAVHFLLFNRPDVAPAVVRDLPLTHYFPMPLPAMTARSGWGAGVDSDIVAVQMIGGGWQFNNHHHADAGSFQIYHRGLLAPDIGQYNRYGTAYDWFFNKATISHNAMLIRDPAAPMERPHGGIYTSGQTLPAGCGEPGNLEHMIQYGYQTADTTAHAFGPDAKLPVYSHLKVDLSRAYDRRVTRYIRSFVYINTNNPEVPGVLTVFDHVKTAKPEYEKIWCLNSYEKPQITGSVIASEWTGFGCRGQIKTVSLLPENARITTGPAVMFRGGSLTPPSPETPSGKAFRTEILPGKPALQDTFLTMLAVGRAGKPLPFTVKLVRDEKTLGAAGKRHAVFFAADGKLLQDPFAVTIPADGLRAVVTDLAPGCWEVVYDGKVVARRKVPAADGTIYFVADKAGKYTLRPAEEWGPDTLFPKELAVPASGSAGISLDGKMLFPQCPVFRNGVPYVPVRLLAGKAFSAKADGFELKQPDGSVWSFRAGQKSFQAGSMTVFADAAPIRVKGEWLYPAESLATILRLSLIPGVSRDAVRFNSVKPQPGYLPIAAAHSPSISDAPLSQLFDGDTVSYWAGNQDTAWVNLFLGGERTVDAVELLWRQGDRREYRFEILVSQDGKTYSKVFDGVSQKKEGFETVKFKEPVKAAFLKLIGHGSNANEWTSIHELRILGK